MKMKKIQKPFSLEAWKNGAKIETRDEFPVRIICTDFNSSIDEKSIVAAVTYPGGSEALRRFYPNGHYFPSDEDNADIVIVEEIEEPKRWAEDNKASGKGFYIDTYSRIFSNTFNLNKTSNYNAFATKKQAKSALAMARISQLMAHDERYGGAVTDEEWENGALEKYAIRRYDGKIDCSIIRSTNFFLAFHTKKQRDLFLEENERLVKDYLMID